MAVAIASSMLMAHALREPDAAALLLRLSDRRALERASAAYALAEHPSPVGTSALVLLLADSVRFVQQDALAALVTIAARDSASGSAVTRLAIRALTSPSGADARLNALRLLGAMGPIAGEAVPVIASIARDGDASWRDASATALGRLGVADRAVVDALLRLASDSVPEVRWAARDALARLDTGAPPVTPR